MLKYVVLILSLTLLTGIAESQPATAPANAAQVQRLTAEREVMNISSSSDFQQKLERGQIARVIVERQAQLRRDTEKLVALAAELKQHVDQTGPNILSMDVIKKAQEIQKLAKSVQDKMKNA
jgi:phospholipid N-methyltransferase